MAAESGGAGPGHVEQMLSKSLWPYGPSTLHRQTLWQRKTVDLSGQREPLAGRSIQEG